MDVKQVVFGSVHAALSFVNFILAIVFLLRELRQKKRGAAQAFLIQLYIFAALTSILTLADFGLMKLLLALIPDTPDTKGALQYSYVVNGEISALRLFFYFSTYLRLLFFWVNVYSAYFGTFFERCLFKTKKRSSVSILFSYSILFVILQIAYMAQPVAYQFGYHGYNLNVMRTIAMMTISSILSVLFLVYGVRLFRVLRRSAAFTQSASADTSYDDSKTKRLIVIALISVLGFLVNAIEYAVVRSIRDWDKQVWLQYASFGMIIVTYHLPYSALLLVLATKKKSVRSGSSRKSRGGGTLKSSSAYSRQLQQRFLTSVSEDDDSLTAAMLVTPPTATNEGDVEYDAGADGLFAANEMSEGTSTLYIRMKDTSG